ncbi:hypothetical protein Tco_1575304 [Tanacetum coccineum]
MNFIDVDSERFYTECLIGYLVKRANRLDYRFTKSDYQNLHPQDIDDLYHSRISYLYEPENDQDIKDSLEIFIRSQATVVHVEDFHIGITMKNSGEWRLIRMDELMKFSSGTLSWVLENMEKMIDQDFYKIVVIKDVEQRTWLGLVAQYIDERLSLQRLWKQM